MKVLFLGAGNVGSNAAKQLSKSRPEVQIRIGDLYLESARRAAEAAGSGAEAVQVDVHDKDSLAAALRGVDIVLNTAGPFYRNADAIMEGAIAAGVHYIDINDDDDVAVRVLADEDLNSRAAEAGIRIVIGCGTTPGVSNVIARHSLDRLDVPSRVFVTMLLSFQAVRYYSPAVVDHMFHISTGDVTRYEGGNFTSVPGFGDEREVRGLAPYGTYLSYNAGHGETAMLGHSFPMLDEVSVRLAWVEQGASDRWRALIAAGLSSGEALEAGGVSPVKFLGALVGSDRQLPFFDDFGDEPMRNGCLVEVEGTRGGRRTTIKTLMNFVGSEDGQDPTSTAARIGVEALIDDRVTGTGVLTPEVCFEPADFLDHFVASPEVTLDQETFVVGSFPDPVA
ncbi:saccharopine dehydrogenase NADP-binding domain-containing protein [Streptomyces sp. NPDC004539]|uniref:saccharopine dehydrogenase NADP-binding domain-containing protein n=1 Tax=Streptomyces sp. NPDC004539 TaxID=3154280 RepID=UPI0033A1B1A3